jgi:hypothetical protein
VIRRASGIPPHSRTRSAATADYGGVLHDDADGLLDFAGVLGAVTC